MFEKALDAVVKWFSEHLSPRYLAVISLITGLLLFLPEKALSYFSALEIATKYRGWLSIAFAFCILLIASYPIEKKYNSWANKKAIRDFLKNLPGHEANLVRRCLLNDGRATNLIADEGTARSLEKKGILWRSTDWGESGRAGCGYNITVSAHTVLKEREFVEMFTPEKLPK